jgi:mono/diheme cytochrome c family protein
VSKRPFILFGLFAAICLIVLPLLAMRHQDSPDSGAVQVAEADEDAKELFADNCGACHTLAAAGTDGIVGPDLDEFLFTTGTNDGSQFDATNTRVYGAVICGVQGRMPKGILIGEEAKEVSAFVAAYGARIGQGPAGDTDNPPEPGTPSCEAPAG